MGNLMPLIATIFKGKKMAAPMYFIGDNTRLCQLRKKGYTDIKIDSY